MSCIRIASVFVTMAASLLLTACALPFNPGPYPGVPELVSPGSMARWDEDRNRNRKVIPIQVVYRIDEDRHFELQPDRDARGDCMDATVFYVDKARGIRSSVVRWDRGVAGAKNFIIDAANDQYLIGPGTRGNTDCSSGGGYCRGDRLPYSTDGGRTWKDADARSASSPMSITGSQVFAIHSIRFIDTIDIAKEPLTMRDWKFLPDGVQPLKPRIPPIDTKFHCISN